ncbi:MAG TPA: trehalose-6-phosphate synthase [Rhodoblastus sp.]|nr:trehalose-6-phosphate synthase [Rhodoblastus sp.]
MARLVIVSNRVALPGEKRAGGLAVAVKAALRGRKGVWCGWSGRTTEDTPGAPEVIDGRNVTYVALDLSAADYQEYYNGFANSVLWPLLHYRVDLQEYSRADLTGYIRVNSYFADQVSKILQPDDIVWVHDYHLMRLAQELRARGHDNPMGFFLHIPCPPPDILQALPRNAESIGALAAFDLVGFQTDNDTDNYGKYLETRGATPSRGGRYFEIDGRRMQIDSFPVGIETGIYARAARAAQHSTFIQDMLTSLGGRKLLLGVDRLDYSKGIVQRMQAFEHLLAEKPQWRGAATFLQITPKSREQAKGYKEMEDMVTALVGQINGEYGEAAWTPIRYVNRSYSRKQLAGIYRSAEVALVTPLRDGMNLVAKEYVAAQDETNPGVLVLSQFAGAASELEGALIVNPHEREAVSAAIERALTMPREERIARHARMFERITEYDVTRWAETFIARLAEARNKWSLIDGIRQIFAPRNADARAAGRRLV